MRILSADYLTARKMANRDYSQGTGSDGFLYNRTRKYGNESISQKVTKKIPCISANSCKATAGYAIPTKHKYMVSQIRRKGKKNGIQ